MKKNLILTFVLMLLAATSVSAKSVVVVLNDSTKIYYLISNGKPVLKMQEKGFTVNNQDTYEFDTFDRFFISNEDSDPTGIQQLTENELLFEDGSLVVESSMRAMLYSIDGKPMNVTMRQMGSKQAFELSALPRGTYILRYGNKSMKFTKK